MYASPCVFANICHCMFFKICIIFVFIIFPFSFLGCIRKNGKNNWKEFYKKFRFYQIFAVVSIGLLHGLFFLPVLLCALPKSKREQSRLRLSTATQIPQKSKIILNSKEVENTNNGVVIIGEGEGKLLCGKQQR